MKMAVSEKLQYGVLPLTPIRCLVGLPLAPITYRPLPFAARIPHGRSPEDTRTSNPWAAGRYVRGDPAGGQRDVEEAAGCVGHLDGLPDRRSDE